MQVKMDSSHLDDLMTRKDAMNRTEHALKETLNNVLKQVQINIVGTSNNIAKNNADINRMLSGLMLVFGDDEAAPIIKSIMEHCNANLLQVNKLIGQLDVDIAMLEKPNKIPRKLH